MLCSGNHQLFRTLAGVLPASWPAAASGRRWIRKQGKDWPRAAHRHPQARIGLAQQGQAWRTLGPASASTTTADRCAGAAMSLPGQAASKGPWRRLWRRSSKFQLALQVEVAAQFAARPYGPGVEAARRGVLDQQHTPV